MRSSASNRIRQGLTNLAVSLTLLSCSDLTPMSPTSMIFARAEYLCVFGPDAQGNLSEKIVKKRVAKSCDKCQCEAIMTECMFGPDARGEFLHQVVKEEVANACDRDMCICSSHGPDYVELVEKRQSEALDRISMAKANSVNGSNQQVVVKANEKADTNQLKSLHSVNVEDNVHYMCSFGMDSAGNEVKGVLSSLAYEITCNHLDSSAYGDEFCDCQKMDISKKVTGQADEGTTGLAFEVPDLVSIGIGLAALIVICCASILACSCLLKRH